MDAGNYNRLVKEFSKNLESMKEDFNNITSRPYVDDERLEDIAKNISNDMYRLNNLKLGLVETCKFYEGFEQLSRDYGSFRTELDLNYSKFDKVS